MRHRPRPFDIVHVSSAHPWTDGRIHLRGAASAAEAGYRTALVAVEALGVGPDADWAQPDPATGVYVRRIPARGRVRRAVVSSVQVVAAALSSRAVIVHLHDPELVWAVPVLRAMGRAVVYDAHEDLPDQVRGKAYLGPVVRRFAVVAARLVVGIAGRADVVVAATPTIAERFPAPRTTVVRNFPVQRAADARAAVSVGRAPAAVYLGSVSRDRGVDVVTGAAGSARLPDGWTIVVAGPVEASLDGHRFHELVEAGRIDYRGVLGPDDARDLLLQARVGLLPLLPTPAYAASIPTKLFEYMSAGLGVVATDIPLWRELLADTACVTWVPPGNAGAVVDAIRRYDGDPELLARQARAGRELATAVFRWDREAVVLLNLYSRLSAAPLKLF